MKKIRYYLSGVTRDGKAVLCFICAVVLALGIFGIGRAGIDSLVTGDARVRLTAYIVFGLAAALILATMLWKMWERRFNIGDYVAEILFFTALASCADLAVFYDTPIFLPLLIAAAVALALSVAVFAVRIFRVDPAAETLEIVTGKPNLITYAAQLFRGGSLIFSVAGAVTMAAFVSVYLRHDYFGDIRTDAVLRLAALVVLCLVGVAMLAGFIQRLVKKRICLTDGIFFTFTLGVLLSLYPVLSTITTMRVTVAAVSVGVCLIAEITLIATARLSQYVTAETKGMRAYLRTFFCRVPVLLVTAFALVSFFLVIRSDQTGIWTRLLDTPEKVAAAVGGTASLLIFCFAVGATARSFGTFDSVTLFIDEFALLSLVRCLVFDSSPAAYASFAALAVLGVTLTLFRMGNAYVPGFREEPEPVVIELSDQATLGAAAHQTTDAEPTEAQLPAETPATLSEQPLPTETVADAAERVEAVTEEPTEQPDDFVEVPDEADEDAAETPSPQEPPLAPENATEQTDAPPLTTATDEPATEAARDQATAAIIANAPADKTDTAIIDDLTAIGTTVGDETATQATEPAANAPITQALPAQPLDDAQPTLAPLFAVNPYPAKKSYAVSLRTLPEETKEFYSLIKNELLRYRMRARVSEHKEDFNKSGASYSRVRPERRIRTQARLVARGKTLRLYLNLDPAALDAARYRHRDVSDKRRFADLPTMMRITSRRMTERALELIAYLAEREGFAPKKRYQPVDFTVELSKAGLTEFERNGYGYLIRASVTAEDVADMTELASKATETDSCRDRTERKIAATLTTDELARYARLGVVNKEILREAGAIEPDCNYLIAAEGTKLDTKLTVRADEFTPRAALMIALTGGDAIVETEREAH